MRILLVIVVLLAVLAPVHAQSVHGGRMIVTEVAGADTNVVSIRLDGSDRRVLAAGMDPSYTPDGRAVVFVRRDGTRSTVLRVAAQGGKAEPLFETPGTVFGLAPSPDGKRMAYGWLESPGTTPIVVVSSIDGRRLTQLGKGMANYGAAWSPDGRALAVASIGEKQGGVRILDVASGRTLRTLAGAPAVSVAWGRDRVAWIEAGDISVVRCASTRGGAVQTVTGGKQVLAGLAFGDDGKTLYWSRFRDGDEGSEICTRGPSGTVRVACATPPRRTYFLNGGYFLLIYQATARVKPD